MPIRSERSPEGASAGENYHSALPEAFISEIETFYESLWRDYESIEPDHLFHYTSTEGLIGIVTSRKFFASDILTSNDRSEIRYGTGLVIDVLQERLKNVSGDLLLGSLLDAFQRDDGLVGLGSDYFIHTVCFCRGRDVLTQWRAYSSMGGFAVGVDFKKLRARATNGEFGIARMLYEKDKQKEVVWKILEHSRELYRRLIPQLDGRSQQDSKFALDQLVLEVGLSLLKSIQHFKNEAFQSEDEWRVFTIDKINESPENLKFRLSGNRPIPYTELRFTPDLITHIHRSPGLCPPSLDYAVRRLAMSVGKHVVVDTSQLPL